MKAVLQYDATPFFRQALHEQERDWLSITVVPETDRATFAREMQDADVLLHVLEPVTAAVITQAPRLRLIQKVGVGVNTIDLEAARAHGVMVANMPGVNAQAVAETTLMLMLMVLRRAVELDEATRTDRGWTLDRRVFDQVGELQGRTVGFVGFGAIPRLVAPVCAALGSTVIYHATTPKPEMPWEFVTLPELFRRSDVVSLHIPVDASTAGLIDAEALRQFKPGAVLINTARGGLVDEQALVAALRSGHLRGAGLDVFAAEPVEPGNPLLSLDSVVVQPHTAWLTPETLSRSVRIAAENCRRVHTGEPLLNRVV